MKTNRKTKRQSKDQKELQELQKILIHELEKILSLDDEKKNVQTNTSPNDFKGLSKKDTINQLLQYIIFNESFENLDILISKYKVDINKSINVDNTEIPLIHHAIANDSIKMLTKLIERGANINIVDADGFTPLYIAIENRQFEVIKALINAKCDVNIGDNQNVTPWLLAAKYNFLEVAELLIKSGAKIDVVDINGQSALHYCAVGGSIETFKFLLANGANINAISKNYKNIIDLAITEGRIDFARTLITEYDPGKEIIFNEDILKLAVSKGDENISSIECILDNYAIDINKYLWNDLGGCNLLFHAACYGHKKLAQLYINKYGADINIRNNININAIEIAAQNAKIEIIDLFLKEYNVDVNAQDLEGHTLLFHILNSRNIDQIADTIEYLIKECKADINIGPNKQNTIKIPLYFAIINKNIFDIDIIELLSGNNQKYLIEALRLAILKDNQELVESLTEKDPFLLLHEIGTEKSIQNRVKGKISTNMAEYLKNKTDILMMLNKLITKDSIKCADNTEIFDSTIAKFIKSVPTYRNISITELTSKEEYDFYDIFKTHFHSLISVALNQAIKQDFNQAINLLSILHNNMQKAGIFTKYVVRDTIKKDNIDKSITLAKLMVQDNVILHIYDNEYDTFKASAIPSLKCITGYKLASEVVKSMKNMDPKNNVAKKIDTKITNIFIPEGLLDYINNLIQFVINHTNNLTEEQKMNLSRDQLKCHLDSYQQEMINEEREISGASMIEDSGHY